MAWYRILSSCNQEKHYLVYIYNIYIYIYITTQMRNIILFVDLFFSHYSNVFFIIFFLCKFLSFFFVLSVKNYLLNYIYFLHKSIHSIHIKMNARYDVNFILFLNNKSSLYWYEWITRVRFVLYIEFVFFFFNFPLVVIFLYFKEILISPFMYYVF